jgi:hypothetical protein
MTNPIRTAFIIAVISIATIGICSISWGAEGKVIAKKDLPASIQAAKNAPKFPGIPSCAKGRLETTEWPASVDKDKHPCADAQTLYVCAAFGKVSVRCELK